MTEDTPIYNGQTLVVTTDDGTLFGCTPYTFRARSRRRVMRASYALRRREQWALAEEEGLGEHHARVSVGGVHAPQIEHFATIGAKTWDGKAEPTSNLGIVKGIRRRESDDTLK